MRGNTRTTEFLSCPEPSLVRAIRNRSNWNVLELIHDDFLCLYWWLSQVDLLRLLQSWSATSRILIRKKIQFQLQKVDCRFLRFILSKDRYCQSINSPLLYFQKLRRCNGDRPMLSLLSEPTQRGSMMFPAPLIRPTALGNQPHLAIPSMVSLSLLKYLQGRLWIRHIPTIKPRLPTSKWTDNENWKG